jgi:hypothetical protein
MKVRPTELWSWNIGLCTVPDLTMEQYQSLQDRQDTEVDETTAKYLIDYNYAEEAKE